MSLRSAQPEWQLERLRLGHAVVAAIGALTLLLYCAGTARGAMLDKSARAAVSGTGW